MLAKSDMTTRNSAAPGLGMHPGITAGPDSEIAKALYSSRTIRRSIQSIMHYAKRGAHDLYSGLSWSNSLERFETLSMEQARALANFPIESANPRFGPAVRQAQLAFIGFRETVRREAIAIIEPDIQEGVLSEVLEKISGKADTAVEKLETLERSLAAN